MKDQTSPTVANNENPGSSSGSITRRQAIAGGMSGLVAAVLSAKTAVAQVALPQPLLRFGGLCEGRVLKFNAADSLAWIQKMLTKSPSLRAFHDHFTAEGMNFILSRSQVFLHMATGSGSTAGMAPNIVGIMPSFRQIKQSDPSHTAVGLGVNQRGNAFASGVVVGHNPFAIQKFMTHDLLATGEIATKEITADSLTTMTVAEAAAQLGNPPIPDGLIGPNPVFLAEPDRSATLALAYQIILKDSYSRALYPPAGLTAMTAQTPLVQKFGEAIRQRYENAAGAGAALSLCLCCSSSSNVCTSCSWIGDLL